MAESSSSNAPFYRLLAIVVLGLAAAFVLHLAPDSFAARVIAVVFSILCLLELVEPLFWLFRKLR